MIKIYDNVFSLEENNFLYNHLVYERNYFYGERDHPDAVACGLISNIKSPDELYIKLYNISSQLDNQLKNYIVERAYINLFLPVDRPCFHVDGNVITTIFYINPPVSLYESGETQFIIDDELINVVAKPARMVVFDGMIAHRATSFRNIPRITVALKFVKSHK